MSRTRNLGNLTDLLTAGSTYVTAATPPQFDNSTNIPTTAFVQRALGNFQAFVPITANTTLTNAQTGSVFECTGSTALTITLPAPTTSNLTYTIINMTSAVVTLTTPSGNIVGMGANGPSQILNATTSTRLISDGGNWIAITGAGVCYFATNGYQKLSSGLIMQWGGVYQSSSQNVGVTFPIVFPNAVLWSGATSSNSTGANNGASTYGATTSGVAVALNSPYSFTWSAFGY